MLTMTETAAEAVKSIVSRVPELPEQGGVRISDSGGDQGFDLRVAPSPESSDTVVTTEGAHVFLDVAAASALDDRVLDAELTPDGSVRFALGTQA